jgi:cyclase
VGTRAAVVGVGILLGIARSGAVSGAESAEIYRLETVAPGVFAAIPRPGGSPGACNAGFVVGSEAVLAVDPGASPDEARELMAAIRAKTPLPVRWLVVTGDRRPDVGGRTVFAGAGAVEVAHDSERRRPGIAYENRITIWLGDRRVDVFARPGRSAESSLVWVPDADVLFAGELLRKKSFPDLTGARTDAWIRTLDSLLLDHPAATFVPGHGDVAKALDVRQFRDYLSALRLAVARALRQGKSGPALIEAVRPWLLVRFSSWTNLEVVDSNVADTEAELTSATKSSGPPAP